MYFFFISFNVVHKGLGMLPNPNNNSDKSVTRNANSLSAVNVSKFNKVGKKKNTDAVATDDEKSMRRFS